MTKTRGPVGGVAWEDPPEHPDRPDWVAVAADLRSHPMRWLKVFEAGRTSWKETVSQGHVAVLHPDLGFEFRTTDNVRNGPGPRTCTLFMRYNPEAADEVTTIIRERRP